MANATIKNVDYFYDLGSEDAQFNEDSRAASILIHESSAAFNAYVDGWEDYFDHYDAEDRVAYYRSPCE